VTDEDARGDGFHAVDDHPEVTMLLRAMDETARWEATQQLRAWERERLALRPGQRLLDVGCGLGDAAIALSADLGEHGEVVGVDGSKVMIAEPQVRAADDSFDAVRSERMLQWVPDPGRAVAEMARVVRPGGLVCLTDTDWSTYDIDVGDPDLARRVRDTFGVERHRPTTVGGRLVSLAKAVGLRALAETSATHVCSRWDPDVSPRPDGWAPMAIVADELIAAGQLAADERDQFRREPRRRCAPRPLHDEPDDARAGHSRPRL